MGALDDLLNTPNDAASPWDISRSVDQLPPKAMFSTQRIPIGPRSRLESDTAGQNLWQAVHGGSPVNTQDILHWLMGWGALGLMGHKKPRYYETLLRDDET